MKKVTVVFEDDGLYTAMKVQAARMNRPLKALVAEALEAWLEVQEEAEDAVLARESLAEYREKGGVAWEEVKAEMHRILAQRGLRVNQPSARV